MKLDHVTKKMNLVTEFDPDFLKGVMLEYETTKKFSFEVYINFPSTCYKTHEPIDHKFIAISLYLKTINNKLNARVASILIYCNSISFPCVASHNDCSHISVSRDFWRSFLIC